MHVLSIMMFMNFLPDTYLQSAKYKTTEKKKINE